MNIYKAAENNELEHLQFFIKEGENINQKNQQDHTPLFLAIKEQHIECICLLLLAGATLPTIKKLNPVAVEQASYLSLKP